MLTQQRLKEIVSYDPDTGKFTWLECKYRSKVGTVAGSETGPGYWSVCILNTRYRAHRLAWFYTFGVWPNGEIDHIDRNGMNNRIANLREVTKSENHQNTNLRSNNTSGFKGVSMNAGKWQVNIHVRGKNFGLGRFAHLEDAAAAYAAGAAKYHTHNPAALAA